VTAPPIAAASARNAAAILGVLQHELAGRKSILEIGSGTGQHAVAFAAAMPGLVWQPSDLAGNHAGIQAHIDASGSDNVQPPLELDVRAARIDTSVYDAVFTSNTMHIMSFAAVQHMLVLVASLLPTGGVFCAYGPFRVGDAFNADSNAAFDASLRARDDEQGIRDLEAIDEIAACHNLQRLRSYAMPANNLLLVWSKNGETSQ